MKYKLPVLFGVSILLLGMVLFCRTPNDIPDDSEKSLATLEKIDDFPLYVMRYYGDYGFGDFLKTGIEVTNGSASSEQNNQSKWACTCFAALNQSRDIMLGRNFDWYFHPALLLFTDPPDGFASVSMVDISYFGFSHDNHPNQNSQALLETPLSPFDGMNERGLCVGMMAVPHAEGGNDAQKVTLGSLHVIRLLLDYAKNIDDAISLLQNYNVDFQGGPPVHYLIADSTGESAVLEYINNELKVIRNETTWQVATNFLLYDKTIEQAKASCWRYRLSYESLQQLKGRLTQEQGLGLLDDVSQSNTIWSLIYNSTQAEIRIVMGRSFENVHEFVLE